MDEDGEGRVNELVDWIVHEWDRGFIGVKFTREDAEAMLHIPLSKRDILDSVVWIPNEDGVYSVKSGCCIARLLSREMNGMEGSFGAQNRGLIWPRLWKLHFPNKIKIFGWRACRDILPMRGNLAHRKIIEDGECDLYKQGLKSILHVLWECGSARDVWAGKGQLQKCVGISACSTSCELIGRV